MIHKPIWLAYAEEVRKKLNEKFSGTNHQRLGTGLTVAYKKAWIEKGYRGSFYDWDLLIHRLR